MSAKRCQDAGKSDLGAMWARFWTPRGGPKPSKTIEKIMFFKVFVFFQRRRKNSPNEFPKEAPGRRKWLPGAPRERPGAAQEAPRQRQEWPSATQERPKSRQEANKRSKKGSSYRFRSWGGAREASGSHVEAIWERFWSLGVAFWRQFQDFSFVSSDLLRPPAREAFQATPLQDAERGRGARPRSLTRMLC